MRPYTHELVKMVTAASFAGLLAAEWCSPLVSVTIGVGALWLLVARAG